MTQVAVITGASAGVGRAIAREMAQRGYRLGLLARGRAGLEGALEDVRAMGSDGIVVPTDVADASQVEAAAERVERELGPIDVWVNDAMVTVLSAFENMTPEEFRRVTDVTYLGTVYGTMAALKRMKPRDRGHIMQVGSALAYRAIPLQSAYCGAKHAIRGFTDSIRSELLHAGSRVHMTMAQLPAMNTPQFQWCKSRLSKHPQPVPPIFTPELCARTIVDAIGHHRRELWITGTTWKVILGNKIAPAVGDRYLARNAFDGQQAEDMPYDPDRPDNLFEPVDVERDYGPHGPFTERSKDSSLQAKLSRAFTRGQSGARTALPNTEGRVPRELPEDSDEGRRERERPIEAE